MGDVLMLRHGFGCRRYLLDMYPALYLVTFPLRVLGVIGMVLLALVVLISVKVDRPLTTWSKALDWPFQLMAFLLIKMLFSISRVLSRVDRVGGRRTCFVKAI